MQEKTAKPVLIPFAFLKNVYYNSSILKLEQAYFQVKALKVINDSSLIGYYIY